MTPKQALFTKQIILNKYWLRVPVRAVAYVTGRCNYQCNHCYAADFLRKELSIDEYQEIFNKLSQAGILEVVFLGGEPFLRNDFLDIVKEANNLGLGTKTSTNASYIDKNNVKEIKKYFDGKLQVSLDGSDEETNDRIRGRGTFKKTLRGIECLLEGEVHFSLGFVTNGKNYQNLNAVYNFAKERKIEGLHIMRGMPKGRALSSWTDMILTNNEWIKTIKKIRSFVNPNEIPKLQIDGTYEYENSTEPLGKCLSGCEAGRYELTFLPNGDIIPCDMFHNWVLGNVKTANLEDLWLNNPILNRFRDIGQSVEGKCRECEVDFCNGCRYQALILNGGFEKSDPFCVREELRR